MREVVGHDGGEGHEGGGRGVREEGHEGGGA